MPQITHSEWASDDAFSASKGSAAGSARARAVGTAVPFKRLPFNFCALSLQPFVTPVCTRDGTVFDLERLLAWLEQHGTNPVDGAPLKRAALIDLHFVRNDDGEFVDPVTFKALTDNSHVVALANTGNVFAHDTVDRLNVRAKMWRDLVTDEEFGRKDIITLQDPLNVEGRSLATFQHLKEDGNNLAAGKAVVAPESEQGRAARMLKAREAVAAARAQRDADPGGPGSGASKSVTTSSQNGTSSAAGRSAMAPHNAALHTTGKAAASFTSTGLTPHTAAERALLSEEEWMLKPKRVKRPGYARIRTTHGALELELLPEWAPKAVWNFVHLAKRGYYDGLVFHRNIRHFMLQGGDPAGTGKGGQSVWGRPFADEIEGPLTHGARGVVSMANKGKNTNGSQFFITYRQAPHLDRKHTIFGRVMGGMDVLAKLEAVEVSDKDKRPLEDIAMEQVVVLVDPFEEFRKAKAEQDEAEREKEEIARRGGTDDDKTTWTGKRIRSDAASGSANGSTIGRYLGAASTDEEPSTKKAEHDVASWEAEEPRKKKPKAGGGFGNFDDW